MPAIRHLCTAFAMLAFAGQAYAAPSCTWASTAGPLSYYIDLGAPWVCSRERALSGGDGHNLCGIGGDCREVDDHVVV